MKIKLEHGNPTRFSEVKILAEQLWMGRKVLELSRPVEDRPEPFPSNVNVRVADDSSWTATVQALHRTLWLDARDKDSTVRPWPAVYWYDEAVHIPVECGPGDVTLDEDGQHRISEECLRRQHYRTDPDMPLPDQEHLNKLIKRYL